MLGCQKQQPNYGYYGYGAYSICEESYNAARS
jgi:hypothetical protein